MAISVNPLATPSTVVIDPATGQPKLTGQVVNDLMSNINNAVTEYGQSQAEALAAQGYSGEAASYNSAAAVARQNERLAAASGQLEQAKIGLDVSKTIGSQQAGIAAAGFSSGGTALSLMRSSQRQGIIDQQTAGVNSEIQQGGFEQQGLAADAEAKAAATSAATASSLSATASTVATALKTNANSMATSLALNIPGLKDLSATSMPTFNAADPQSFQQPVAGPGVPLKPQPSLGPTGLPLPSSSAFFSG